MSKQDVADPRDALHSTPIHDIKYEKDGKPSNPSSQFFFDISNVFKGWIGSSFMGMPYGFSRAGWLASMLVLALLSGMAYYCCQLLVITKYKLKKQLSESSKSLDFGDIAYNVLGKYGRVTMDALLVFTQFGFCTSYLIFILRNAADIWPGSSYLLLAIVLVLLMPLLMMNEVDKLAPYSMLATVFMFGSLAVMYFSFSWTTFDAQVPMYDPAGLFIFFGIASSAMEGIGLVLPFESAFGRRAAAGGAVTATATDDEMIPASGLYYLKILAYSVGTSCLILCSFGYLGAGTFGLGTQSVITLNLEDGTSIKLVSQALIVLAVFFTYPLQFFPIATIVENRLWGPSKPKPPPNFDVHRFSLRFGLAACSALIAIGIPEFGLVYSFVGSLGGSMLAFVLPMMFYLKVGKPVGVERASIYAMLAVAAMCTISGTFVSLGEILQHFAHHTKHPVL